MIAAAEKNVELIPRTVRLQRSEVSGRSGPGYCGMAFSSGAVHPSPLPADVREQPPVTSTMHDDDLAPAMPYGHGTVAHPAATPRSPSDLRRRTPSEVSQNPPSEVSLYPPGSVASESGMTRDTSRLSHDELLAEDEFDEDDYEVGHGAIAHDSTGHDRTGP